MTFARAESRYRDHEHKRVLLLFLCACIVVTSCGSPSPNPAPTHELTTLTGRQLDNLIAFSRLLGYIQYFHPSDQASDVDWEQFAIQGLVFAEKAADRVDLASRLNSLFQPLAPTVHVFETDKDPPSLINEMLPIGKKPLQIVAWQHYGFGQGIDQQLYHSERVYTTVQQDRVPSPMPDPRKPFVVDLGGGVSALIPLALFVEEGGTLPYHSARIELTPSKQVPPDSDRDQRLATVILAWNVFQHFYPYFDVVQTDWPVALRNSLVAAESAKDQEQFLDVLREMAAQLHDGHAQVQYAFFLEPYRPPFGWDWVENQLVITFVENEAEGQVKPGDMVIAIDGQPTPSVLADQERLISGATSQWIRFNALKNLIEGPQNSTLTLKLQPLRGPSYEAAFKRTVYLSYRDEFLFTEQRPQPISELKPGIWYVDLSRINDSQFDKNMPDLARAGGIIFDMRGYPFDIGLGPISHIIEHSVKWPQLRIPLITYPDRKKTSFDTIVQHVEPLPPHFPGKIAFITDGRAISYAESYLGIIESNKIADIVGEPTAGTNGNIASFTLFGKYTFWFTGMQVLKLDGSQHHGVGIQSTVSATRTLQGVREGRDELLESAIIIVTSK